jgi:phenylalanyl-tRNA synthetase beta chain
MLLPLANPLSSDMNVLRPSLLPGLLDALRHNLSHRNTDLALFEIGRVFLGAATPPAQKGDNSGVREERRLAIALTGKRSPLFWSGPDREALFDVFDLKGVVDEFLNQFGIRSFTYSRRPENTPLFLESGVIQLGKFQLGEFGQLLPMLARRYDLRDPVFLAELNLDTLLARRNRSKSFRSLPSQPSVRRDVAMIVPEMTSHDAVLQAVKQSKPANLESVELFDVFRGRNVPAGQKSVAYAFTYRNAERSLTDAEVNAAHEKVIAQLKESLGATIRDN